MNRPEPFQINGQEFIRRWSLHILPKGFTRSRYYGGYHSHQRKAYLNQCRELLNDNEADSNPPSPSNPNGLKDTQNQTAEALAKCPKCPRCDVETVLVRWQPRPSWADVLTDKSNKTSTQPARDISLPNAHQPPINRGPPWLTRPNRWVSISTHLQSY